MKRTFHLSVFLLSLLSLCLLGVPAFAEQPQTVYVALGDSITAGIGLPDVQYSFAESGAYDMTDNYQGYSADCYVALVAQGIGSDQEHAQNYGLPAANSSDLAALLDACVDGDPELLAAQKYNVSALPELLKSADVISVQIGSNDAFVTTVGALGKATNQKVVPSVYAFMTGALRDMTPAKLLDFFFSVNEIELTTEEETALWNTLLFGIGEICNEAYPQVTANLEQIVQSIRALNPDAQILLLGYYNPVPVSVDWSLYFGRLNRFERQLARQYEGVTYVPLTGTPTAVDAHPSVRGHRFIARKILNAVA